eukprot:5880400-Prymnesium_polylepis.1
MEGARVVPQGDGRALLLLLWEPPLHLACLEMCVRSLPHLQVEGHLHEGGRDVVPARVHPSVEGAASPGAMVHRQDGPQPAQPARVPFRVDAPDLQPPCLRRRRIFRVLRRLQCLIHRHAAMGASRRWASRQLCRQLRLAVRRRDLREVREGVAMVRDPLVHEVAAGRGLAFLEIRPHALGKEAPEAHAVSAHGGVDRPPSVCSSRVPPADELHLSRLPRPRHRWRHVCALAQRLALVWCGSRYLQLHVTPEAH